MSNQRIPKSRHETIFWVAVILLAAVMLLFLMQTAVGLR